jgi:uncharacterized protein (TIGR02722 family)
MCLFAAVALLVASGCATTAGGSRTAYVDPTAVNTTSIDFSSTDLQQIAAKSVDSLLSFPPIVEVTSQRRPVMFVDSIKNKTMEHIDTESITDTISTKLLQSGKFRFADMTKVNVVMQQLNYQNSSGLVDPNTAAQIGRQIGAEYMMYGNFSSIESRDGRTKGVYYKFTLRVMNVQSGIVEWMDEKEISKQSTRKLVGG